MWTVPLLSPGSSKPELYALVMAQLRALIEDEADPIANMANTAALLFYALPDVNWVGFYLLKDGGLVVGPFQGRPACVRIPLGRGVCGTAAERRRTVCVPNVDEFPGHIACDSASKSELVVPLISPRGELIGVLDIDSPVLDRFDSEDEASLEKIAAVLAQKL